MILIFYKITLTIKSEINVDNFVLGGVVSM